MAAPLQRSVPTAVVTAKVAGASGAATGIQLTYTCPAGRVSCLRWASVVLTNLAPTVAIQATLAGVTCKISSAALNQSVAPSIWLQPADTVTINVTTLIAASTFDAVIGCDEFEAL